MIEIETGAWCRRSVFKNPGDALISSRNGREGWFKLAGRLLALTCYTHEKGEEDVVVRYYVVWPNGQRFGPADLPTLTQWAQERRIDANTTLIEEQSLRTFRAGDLIPMPGPSPQSPYGSSSPAAGPHAPYGSPGTPGYDPLRQTYHPIPPQTFQDPPLRGTNGDLMISYVLSCLSVPCLCGGTVGVFLAIGGLVMASVAKKKRQPGAQGAQALAIVLIVINVVIAILGGAIGVFNPF